MSWNFQKDFLRLDGSRESKIAVIVAVLSILVFVTWASYMKDYFVMGYKEGIKECWVSQEGFVEMTEGGKSLYGNYFNLTTNMTVEEMMEFLDKIKIKQL